LNGSRTRKYNEKIQFIPDTFCFLVYNFIIEGSFWETAQISVKPRYREQELPGYRPVKSISERHHKIRTGAQSLMGFYVWQYHFWYDILRYFYVRGALSQ